MVRKVITLITALAMVVAFGTTSLAVDYEVYDGNPSNTYIQYFKDIVSGIDVKDNYVAFRSNQYDYVMVVGDLEYSNGRFTLNGTGTAYTISSSGNYNATYSYSVEEIDSLAVNTNDKLIYSDLGNYPQLVERGAKFEIVTTLLLVVALLCVVIGRIFRHR